MGEDTGHVTDGVALVTVSVTAACAAVKFTVSAGVKVTEGVCVPAVSTAQAAGM